MHRDYPTAQLSHAIYGGESVFGQCVAQIPGEVVSWEYIDEDQFGICVGLIKLKDRNIIIFRGTMPTHLQDWLIDLCAFVNPVIHPTFGPTHFGASFMMERLMFQVSRKIDLTLPTEIGGHSLGGQRAQYAAGLMLEVYQPNPALLRYVSIAGPAVGFQKFLDFTKDVDKIVYRNAWSFWGDQVPLFPYHVAPLFAYRNPLITHITAMPSGGVLHEFNPIDWHSSELYEIAIGKLEDDNDSK